MRANIKNVSTNMKASHPASTYHLSIVCAKPFENKTNKNLITNSTIAIFVDAHIIDFIEVTVSTILIVSFWINHWFGLHHV